LQYFPDNCDTLKVAKGNAFLIKKDIFKNLMWYTLPDSNKQYPLSIERVVKIKSLNQQGVFPEELEPVEVTTGKPKEVEPEFVDVVGQISLRTLDKSDRKKRMPNDRPQREREQRDNRNQGNARAQGSQGNQNGPPSPPRQQGPARQQTTQRPPKQQGQQGSAPRQAGTQGTPKPGPKQQRDPRDQRNSRNETSKENKPPLDDKRK
jgi:hypothetical protein